MGIIDSTGSLVTPLRYEVIGPLTFGHRTCEVEGRAGVLDGDGSGSIAPGYDACTLMEGGVVQVELAERTAYIRLSDRRAIWKEEGFDAPRP